VPAAATSGKNIAKARSFLPATPTKNKRSTMTVLGAFMLPAIKSKAADMGDIVFNDFEMFLFGQIQQERRPKADVLYTYEDHVWRKTKVHTVERNVEFGRVLRLGIIRTWVCYFSDGNAEAGDARNLIRTSLQSWPS
jgi:hypothetical protein